METYLKSEEYRKWPKSLFWPVQARSWKERSEAGWDQDRPGWPADGSETMQTKHMVNLDGTPLDLRWDLDGPRIGPRRGPGWHSRDSNRLLGLSENSKALTAIRAVFGLAIRSVRFEVAAHVQVVIRNAANHELRFKTSKWSGDTEKFFELISYKLAFMNSRLLATSRIHFNE